MKYQEHLVGSIHRVVNIVCLSILFLLVAPSTIGVVQFPTETSSAGAGVQDVVLDTNLEFARLLENDVTFSDAFDSTTDLNDTWTATSGVYKGTGYLNSETSAGESDYANKALSLSSASFHSEMLYISDTLDTDDVVQMNITGGTNQIAVGNEYNVARVWYHNASGIQTVDLGTFAEDVWYSVEIFLNNNYTADVVWKWRDNYTWAGGQHLSDINLSTPSNVTLFNISNTCGGVATSNVYRFEYTFYDSGGCVGSVQTDDTSAWKPITPTDTKTVISIFDKTLDADLGADKGNVSGGTNTTTALGTDYFGSSLPTTLDDLLKDEESTYSTSDIQKMAGMIAEKNETYHHDRLWVYSWGNNLEEAMTDNLKDQVYGSTDTGYVVDYRVSTGTITITITEVFADSIREAFWEEVDEKGGVDIEAFSFGGGIGNAISGSGNYISNGMSWGLDGVHGNALGLVAGVFKNPADFLGAKLANGFYRFKGAAFQMTNAFTGAVLNGLESVTLGAVDFLITTAFKLVALPFTFLLGGSIGTIIFIIVFAVIIILAIFEWKTSFIRDLLKKLKGGVDNTLKKI